MASLELQCQLSEGTSICQALSKHGGIVVVGVPAAAMTALVESYFEQFGAAVICFDDLRPYLPLVPAEDASLLIQRLFAVNDKLKFDHKVHFHTKQSLVSN